ncbi:MAG: polyphosphate polymerase domain-containing protein [Clostridia bacterium]|nr:polyphosphate polymerase domain-containing protein [Clostridia bacterium]
MAFQTVFQRYEIKYMLTATQKDHLLSIMEPYMELDKYGRSSIRNIYFDTDTYRLIRSSIEKPAYKEKLRVRSYGRAAGSDSTVFVELKKKYDHVVYKRRISLAESEAMGWVCGRMSCGKQTQIQREIDYFMAYYETLHPVVFLSYEREAFYARDGSGFRVTFDDTILCREDDLSLCSEAYGSPILPKGKILMEVKCAGGIPLWLARALSEAHIFKTTFSKYGTAYQTMIFPRIYQNVNHTKEMLTYA